MDTTLMILATVVATAVPAGAAVWVVLRRRTWLDTVTARRVVVHTIDGQSLDGWLLRADAAGLRLVDVTLLGDPDVPVDGDVHVHRERVAWVQQPAAAAV